MEARDQARRGFAEFLHLRPALPAMIFLAVGIALADALPVHPAVWIAGALAAAALATPRKLRTFAAPLLMLSLAFCGTAAAQIEHFFFASDSIALYTTSQERLTQLELSLDDEPRLITAPPGELRALPPKETVDATVRQVLTTNGWRPASAQTLLTIEQVDPRLAAGQIVRVIGMIERPSPAMNPGEFDWAAWCRQRRILATVRVGHADAVQVVRQEGGPIIWLRQRARDLLASGFPASRSLDFPLLRTLVFGDSDPQLRDVERQFVQTGTIHDLAISGLHIAIVGALVLLICRLLRRSPRTGVLCSVLAVALYATVALPSWPGWRSAIMWCVAAIGLLNRRSLDALNLLCVAVIIILLIHPGDLANGGFQVSFAAVAGMILLANHWHRRLLEWWRGDDALPAPRIRVGPWLAAARWGIRFAVATALAGTVAWAMSMPLVAYHFGQLNAWSVPAGVVMLPLTVIALVAGIGKILLTLLWPTLAHAWAALALIPIDWIRHAVNFFRRLPGAMIEVQPPGIGALAVYYALLPIAFLRVSRPTLRWSARVAIPAVCIALLVWPTFPAHSSAERDGPEPSLRVTLLSIGAGQCGVVRTRAGHAFFVDCGSSTISDVGERVVIPYLHDRDCTVDRIFLSHGDFDHISAASELFEQYNEPVIYMSPHFERHAVGNAPAEALLRTLMRANRPATIIHRGDEIDLGADAVMDVLWPPVDCDMNSNNCGLVLKLHYRGRTVLFPADIQEPAELALLRDPGQLRADVLVAPHHGSAESTTAAFIRAVHPSVILASNAEKLTHKQRTFDAIAAGYPLYRTHRWGAITLTIDRQGQMSISTFLAGDQPIAAASRAPELAAKLGLKPRQPAVSPSEQGGPKALAAAH